MKIYWQKNMEAKNNLKQDLKEKKPIFGLDRTLKSLKSGEAEKVYISTNCKGKEKIQRYVKLGGVELIELDDNNVALGILCKKPFSISILCFNKK